MAMYVYGTGGEPRGFLFETTVYALDGTPLGRLLGARVHRFDGTYVGEWFHQMVVSRPGARARTIPPVAPPPPRRPMPTGTPRRDVAQYRAFPDAFDLLCDAPAADGSRREAAE
jgi:hypothetical protein